MTPSWLIKLHKDWHKSCEPVAAMGAWQLTHGALVWQDIARRRQLSAKV